MIVGGFEYPPIILTIFAMYLSALRGGEIRILARASFGLER